MTDKERIEFINRAEPSKDRSPLWDFQSVDVENLLKFKRFVLGNDRSMGKSATTLVAARELGAQRVLVVTSNRGTLTWEEETRKWLGEEATILLGTKAQRLKKLRDSTDRFIVVPYGMIRHRKTKSTSKPMAKELLSPKRKWDVIIFDEAHRLGGRKSQQTGGAKALSRQCQYVWMATGSPIRNKPDEIWQLLNILYPKVFNSFWRFVEEFCTIKEGYFGREIGGIKKNKIGQWTLTVGKYLVNRKKEDYLAFLTDKIYDTEWLAHTPTQARITKDLQKQMMASVTKDGQGNIILAANTVQLFQKIRMVNTSPRLLGDDDWGNKIPRAVEILEEHDGQAIVFTHYRESVKQMLAALTAANIKSTFVMGGLSDWVSNQRVSDFRSDTSIRVLVATIGSLSESVNLQNADMMIFLERDYVPENNGQAEDRIHRVGQTRPCVYIDILNLRSIDIRIRKLLENKSSIVNEAMAIKEHFLDIFGDGAII